MHLFGSLGLLVFHVLFLYKLKQGKQTEKSGVCVLALAGLSHTSSSAAACDVYKQLAPTRSQDTNGSENPTQLVFFL